MRGVKLIQRSLWSPHFWNVALLKRRGSARYKQLRATRKVTRALCECLTASSAPDLIENDAALRKTPALQLLNMSLWVQRCMRVMISSYTQFMACWSHWLQSFAEGVGDRRAPQVVWGQRMKIGRKGAFLKAEPQI